MIEPWEIWATDRTGSDNLVVVISSGLHLRMMQGRYVTVLPLCSDDQSIRTHVKVTRTDDDQALWVMTEQVQLINTKHFEKSQPMWKLASDEITSVRRALRHMVDL